jgi:DNA primase
LNRFVDKRKIVANLEYWGALYTEIGEMSRRLIIPIVEGGKAVGYTGRDVTGAAQLKYRGPSGLLLHDLLYNWDEALGPRGNRIVIVEGALDVWRLRGFDDDWTVIATFGTHLSEAQRNRIFLRQPEELVIAWDADAWTLGVKEAGFWVPYIKAVWVLKLPRGEDPDSLGRDGVLESWRSTPAVGG